MLSLFGCSEEKNIESKADFFTFEMVASQRGVDDFLVLLDDENNFGDDPCFNVTPEDITEEYGFTIFKFEDSYSSYLLYENELFPIGISLGGFGIISFAIGDLNADDQNELYFTCSWGSGMHRSNVGYFDTLTKESIIFDFHYPNEDSVLVVEEEMLCVYSVEFNKMDFVDFDLTLQSKLASIKIDEENEIFLDVIENIEN